MEQKDTWYFQIFNWKGKGHCPSIRKRGRIERLGRLRSEKGQEGPNSTFENCLQFEKGQEGPNSTFENCLQFVSSSPSLQSTRPSHLLGTISHCQKDQTLCVAFEKNWRRKRFLACINKFKRKGIANRIVANSCYGLKVVKIIVQLERSHKKCVFFLIWYSLSQIIVCFWSIPALFVKDIPLNHNGIDLPEKEEIANYFGIISTPLLDTAWL